MEIERGYCKEDTCQIPLELSNRYICQKCQLLFCNKHIFQFEHCCIKVDNDGKDVLPPMKVVHPKCGYEKCNMSMNLSNRFECKRCNKLYCVSHRHDFTHKCSFYLKDKTI